MGVCDVRVGVCVSDVYVCVYKNVKVMIAFRIYKWSTLTIEVTFATESSDAVLFKLQLFIYFY